MLLPDLPCRDNEHFHEERIWKSLFGLYHHLKEVCRKIPLNAKVLPTVLAERTSEEEVKGRFFNIHIAKDINVVVAFQLVLFPHKNVPSVESIHH